MEKPTRKQIETFRPTRRQLALWGVPWPPPKGWRKRLLKEADRRDGTKARPRKTRELQPGQLHPHWPEWRWDGEAFERA